MSTISLTRTYIRPANTISQWKLSNIRHGFRGLSTYRPIGQKFVEIKPCESLRSTQLPEYVGSPNSKCASLIWPSPLQNIYVVKKPWQPSVRDAMVQFIKHIHDEYPSINVIVCQDVAEEIESDFKEFPSGTSTPHVLYTGAIEEITKKTDLIVTLGGDGTILRAVHKFSQQSVPPVLSFALGTLGFLLPFDFITFKDTFKMVHSSRAKVLHRNRLECHIVRRAPLQDPHSPETPVESRMVHAMNDISLHRGGEPHLTSLDIYVDNQLLTRTVADGVLFATPTGSTAYSLSAGGSIVHPLVPCILLTPICPRSLSFRPAILPSTSHIMIKIIAKNRNSKIKITIDGIPQPDLKPGDEIHVVSESGTIYLPESSPPPNGDAKALSSKGIYCISNTENDWTKGINELLGFNSGFRGMKKDND